jgi:hypothetical protein
MEFGRFTSQPNPVRGALYIATATSTNTATVVNGTIDLTDVS